jgi:hypothetical protein
MNTVNVNKILNKYNKNNSLTFLQTCYYPLLLSQSRECCLFFGRPTTVYVFLGISRRQIVFCRRFGTLCPVQPLTESSETSEKHNLTPGKYPKENIQYSNHGESLKSRILLL